MKTFVIDKHTEVLNITSSKGCQNKWRIDNVYIKQDNLGYEGLAEYVSSYILAHSNFDSVVYQLCNIKYSDSNETFLGCYSESFLKSGESLITLQRLSELYNFPFDKKYKNLSTLDKIKYIVDNISRVTNLTDFDLYLSDILYIDKVLLNEDRHFNNIAFIYSENNNTYDYAPIFDNGAGLFSDTKIDYPLEIPVSHYYKKIKSKPFVSDFERQTQVMNSICKFDVEFYNLDFRDIEELIKDTPYPTDIKNRVIQILRHQFLIYKIPCKNMTDSQIDSSQHSKISIEVTPFDNTK